MRFVTIRDFRNQTAAIREALSAEGEIVLTANGKPFAILAGVDEDSFEDRLAALRRGRAGSALGRIRAKARADGLDSMSMAQIDAVIAKARRARRPTR